MKSTLSRCMTCAHAFRRTSLKTWTWVELLVKDKTITVEGIRVVECTCSMHPVVPQVDKLIELVTELAYEVQTWRWSSGKKAWLLRHSELRRAQERPRVRGITSASQRREGAELSHSEDTWHSL